MGEPLLLRDLLRRMVEEALAEHVADFGDDPAHAEGRLILEDLLQRINRLKD